MGRLWDARVGRGSRFRVGECVVGGVVGRGVGSAVRVGERAND